MTKMVMQTKVDDKIFLTDEVYGNNYDRVFPLFEDESIYLANHIKVKNDDIVLDIGTGSGILAIFAASKAKKVYATDINLRALNLAKLNAHANGVEQKIKFLKGDGLKPIKNMMFDLVLFNPPFNIAPYGLRGARFSDSGEDGLKLTRNVLKEIKNNVKKNGRIQIITFSPGSEKDPIMIPLITKYLGKNIRIEYTNLFPRIETKKFLKGVFENRYRNWIYKFCRKYPFYYYIFVTIQMDTEFPLVKVLPLKTRFKEHAFDGSWAARINRRKAILGYTYKKIL